MSSSVRLSLPPNVVVERVADVIGRLLGCSATRRALPSSHPRDDAWYLEVDGVSVQGIPSMPQCASIDVRPPKPSAPWRLLYHHEFGPGGRRGILMDVSPTAFAVAVGVARFFGGIVEQEESTDGEVFEPKSDDENCPTDGEPWQDLQRRIEALAPLTEAR